jgi:hypothetical protein
MRLTFIPFSINSLDFDILKISIIFYHAMVTIESGKIPAISSFGFFLIN